MSGSANSRTASTLTLRRLVLGIGPSFSACQSLCSSAQQKNCTLYYCLFCIGTSENALLACILHSRTDTLNGGALAIFIAVEFIRIDIRGDKPDAILDFYLAALSVWSHRCPSTLCPKVKNRSSGIRVSRFSARRTRRGKLSKCRSSWCLQRNNCRVVLQAFQVVGPCLHHPSPLWQVLCVVISRAYLVALSVRQLPLDCVTIPALFIQDRGRHAAETMPSHLMACIA
jgi:hypothetical protein